MSGVIVDGVQWEHCNNCGAWVKYEHLRYDTVSKHIKTQLDREVKWDLCKDCAPRTKTLFVKRTHHVHTHQSRNS